MWPPEVVEIIVVGEESDAGWTLVEVVGVYGHQVDIVKGVPLMKSEVKDQQLVETPDKDFDHVNKQSVPPIHGCLDLQPDLCQDTRSCRKVFFELLNLKQTLHFFVK